MVYPKKAIIHFTTQEDRQALIDFVMAHGKKRTAERLNSRRWHPEQCARLEHGCFYSFGSLRVYADQHWDEYKSHMDPAFLFCSAQQYIELASGCALIEDDTVPDLEDLM